MLAEAIAARDADLCLKLAVALLQQERLDDAFEATKQSLAINGNYSDAWNVLGVLWRQAGNLSQSEVAHRRAIELDPNFAEAWNNLGVVFQDQKRFVDSAEAYQQAVTINPALADTHHNLAKVWRYLGKSSLAQHHCQQASLARPGFVDAWITLSRIQMDVLDFGNAIANLSRACDQAPDHAEAFYYLGMAYENSRMPELAAKAYRRAIELDRTYLSALDALVHQLQHLCDWQDLDLLTTRLIQSVAEQNEFDVPSGQRDIVAPFSFMCLPIETPPDLQLKCAQRLASTFSMASPKSFAKAHDKKTKIRIGYLSADYHAHATARLMAELIEVHDRDRFEIHGYSYGIDDHSVMRSRLIKAFDTFVELKSYSHYDAAERIRADELDILVDLKGYTQFARPQILAYRPAPIQIQYLGYPGTMGAAFVDYVLLDEFIAPTSHSAFYSEKVLRVPGCYQVNDSRFEIGSWPTQRSEVGLPEEAFVYCCFNAHYKITPAVFDIWMKLLKQSPSSVLWLLEGTSASHANLVREAEKRGVDGQRLLFAPKLDSSHHVARHRLADLYLDTFPVTAHTAASDLLRAGLPMVSMIGKSMISRVAGSLLYHLGFPELIASSLDEYESIALKLSKDKATLHDLRKRLTDCVSDHTLFSGQAFARKLEKIYQEIV